MGLDFLVKHGCNVNLVEETLNIGYGGERVPCHRFVSNALSICFKIAVTENIEILSRSEMIVPGTTVDGYLPGQFAFIEGAQKFVERKGLLVAKSLVKVNRDIIPLRVVNLLDEPCRLYKGTIAATGEDVKSEDVCVFEKVQSVSTEETTTDFEPQKIPEHLKDLIDRSSVHLPSNEQNILKDLLCSYQHSFSKDSSDLGHTTLVRHEINTGNSRPIKQRPRRIPLAKLKEASQEISKMKSEGIIEPSVSPWSSNIVLVKKKMVLSDFASTSAS